MPLEIPVAPDIEETHYDNFKGVDFTNDMSNVWYRRTPSGVNMLPDQSGKPYKRKGWKIEYTKAQFTAKYTQDTGNTAPANITINKLYHFEIKGLDHIFVFTNIGVFIIRSDGNGGSSLLSSKDISSTNTLSYEQDVIDAYDRCYFFEGDGKAAFYIYSKMNVWGYGYDDAFFWKLETTTVPTVLIACDAKHESGTTLDAVNLLSDYCDEQFIDNIWRYVSGTAVSGTGITGATTDEDTFFVTFSPTETTSYVFTYSSSESSWTYSGENVSLIAYGITATGTPADGDTITVTVTIEHKISLGRLVKLSDVGKVKVWVSTSVGQFEHEMTVVSSGTPTVSTCVLSNVSSISYITFDATYEGVVTGEDGIKVRYPRDVMASTSTEIEHTNETVVVGG